MSRVLFKLKTYNSSSWTGSLISNWTLRSNTIRVRRLYCQRLLLQFRRSAFRHSTLRVISFVELVQKLGFYRQIRQLTWMLFDSFLDYIGYVLQSRIVMLQLIVTYCDVIRKIFERKLKDVLTPSTAVSVASRPTRRKSQYLQSFVEFFKCVFIFSFLGFKLAISEETLIRYLSTTL